MSSCSSFGFNVKLLMPSLICKQMLKKKDSYCILYQAIAVMPIKSVFGYENTNVSQRKVFLRKKRLLKLLLIPRFQAHLGTIGALI